MNTRVYGVIGAVAALGAVVVGVILSLQNFDAEKVACEDIGDARAWLEAQYNTGVDASVQMFAESRASAEAQLSECLSAKPVDPCADAQKARDDAVKGYESIPSPPDSASYDEFKTYFDKREAAYQTYKRAKDALTECRTANPPNYDIPYEQSSTKACFDVYDASMKATQDRFSDDTQTMRSLITAARAALDAREKACNPPQGNEQFTSLPSSGEGGPSDGTPERIVRCEPIDAEGDSELSALRSEAAALRAQIESLDATIANAEKRKGPLQVDLSEADTYIPPESTKTQFEGALNALRGERKAGIQASLDYYNSLIERKQAEKASRQSELADIEAQIAERLNDIQKENEERQRLYPTALRHAKPDECDYYHCHGMLCGIPDPASDACGHGATTEDDVDCKAFMKAYLKAAGG